MWGTTRTPIGAFGGSLKDVSAVSLATVALESVIQKAGIEKKMVGQVILGNCFEPLDRSVARIALVKAGFPIEIPAFHIVATCGSGMQAIRGCGCCHSEKIREHEHGPLYADNDPLGTAPPARPAHRPFGYVLLCC